MRKLLLSLIIAAFFFGCQFDDDPKLPPVEERIAKATEDLEDLLVAPANGWRIDYRPNFRGGDYLILLDFSRDGNVRIQSDVPANDGEFRDHIIPWRIDSGQGIELILETYGVFHFLFELNQATFGGEFEFIFVQEQEGALIFSSKSDPSAVVFQPAAAGDADLISTNALVDLSQGTFRTPNLAGAGNFVQYNMYLEDINATVSMAMDLDLRRMKIQGIAAGQTTEEILNSTDKLVINHSSVFSIREESLVLEQPRNISFQGQDLSFSSIPIQNLQKITASFCAGQLDSLVTFNSANVAGLGNYTITNSLATTHSEFRELPDDAYGINSGFIYDQDDNPISEAITEVFPDVVAFQWYWGLELNAGGTLNALGWVTVDELNNVSFILREFEATQQGNLLTLNWTGTYFRQESLTQEQIDGANMLTDLIFEGGQVYVLEALSFDDLLEFYNPCNRHKGFIFF